MKWSSIHPPTFVIGKQSHKVKSENLIFVLFSWLLVSLTWKTFGYIKFFKVLIKAKFMTIFGICENNRNWHMSTHCGPGGGPFYGGLGFLKWWFFQIFLFLLVCMQTWKKFIDVGWGWGLLVFLPPRYYSSPSAPNSIQTGFSRLSFQTRSPLKLCTFGTWRRLCHRLSHRLFHRLCHLDTFR